MVREGFRKTEVGTIPREWSVRPLLSVVQIANGQVNPKNEPYRSMILVAPNHIESSTGRLLIKETAIQQKATSGKYLFQENDILYSKIRPYLKKAILADFSGLCSADMYPLKPLKDVSSRFVLAVILGNRFTKYTESVSVRSGMPKINRVELADFSLALPPYQEQQAIAQALSDVDSLIDGLEKLIAKKRAIKTAAMQQLLTGKTRLPGFGKGKGYKQTELGEIPEDWEILPLAVVAELINGRAYAIDEWETHGTPVIRLQNLTGRGDEYYYSTLKLPDKQYCAAGDLLFMWSATFGPVIWEGEKAIYHYHIWKVELKGTYSRSYLYYTLVDMTDRLKRSSSNGGTMLHVTKAEMEATKMCFPSAEEQQAITEVLTDADKELKALQFRLDKTKALKQGMMQELLTGKTRLI